jgi:YVTN family beta-propeller protein
MTIQSQFRRWPLWLRFAAVTASALVFSTALSLMGGCGGASSVANPTEPNFYISHVQDPNAIWYRSEPADPAPLTIAALPPGSSVNQVAALSFTATSDWLYALTSSNLVVLEKVGTSFQTMATVPVGTGAFAFAIDGNADFAYVSNGGSNSVTVVDLNAYKAAATIALPANSQPRGVVLTPDGMKLYVADYGTNSVSVIDTTALAVTGSIAVGSQPNRMAVSPSGHSVYVSNSGSGTVSMIDVSTDTLSTAITGLPNTLAVAVSGNGVSLWAGQAAAQTGPGSIQPYATSTLTAAASNATPGNAFFLAAFDGSSYLAASLNANKVTEYFNESTSTFTAKDLKVGVAPTSVTVARALKRNPSIPTQPQCTLTVTTVGSGTVTVSPTGTGSYPCGTTVTLTAVPGTGQSFFGWSVDLTGTTNPASLTLNTNKNVTATFGTSPKVTITVNTSPTGLAASVNSVNGTAPVSQSVASGIATPVSVTTPQVVSGTGYTFGNWTGTVANPAIASTTVTATANTSVTANFALACYVLTVNVSPPASGAVALSPASGGLAGLPANCYAPGATVTLTATAMAAQNYIFGSWSGAGTGFTTTRTVVMNGPSAVTANFSLYPAPNLNFGGANWGYASGSTYQMAGKVGNNGADYNNIKVTQVVWTAAAGTGAITDTTALPITVGNLAGGTVGSSTTLNATMPTTVTQFTVCISGTAVSPLSGNTVAWTDNQNCSHVFPRN